MLKILFLIVIEAFLLMACVTTRPVEKPIPMKIYAADGGRTDELILFLPGRGDDMDAFERAEFIEILNQSNRAADCVVIDAHMAYYKNGSLSERVYQDILLPYQQKGYRRFIIVGVSLGGYGALWINNEYSDLISGMVLLAPYLGREPLIEKIEASGSIHSWRSQLNDERSYNEKVWVWIDDATDGGHKRIDSTILAFGQEDDSSHAAMLLSESIPESHVFQNSGSHNWKTWRSLWSEITKSYIWENLGYTR